MEDNNLLIAAKKEYTEQLQDIMSENMYNIMKNVWDRVKDKYPKGNTLKQFQQELTGIPGWNQEIITNHYHTILKNEDVSKEYFDKIIEAVFVSNIKILSVVKIKNKKQTINVSIPDTKNFIHKCFIEVARQYYSDPHLIDDREFGSNTYIEIQRNIRRSLKMIRESIEKVIRSLVPMEEILNKYLDAHNSESDDDQEDNKSDDSYHDNPEVPVQQEQISDPPPPQPPLPFEQNHSTQEEVDRVFMQETTPEQGNSVPTANSNDQEEKIKINLNDNDPTNNNVNNHSENFFDSDSDDNNEKVI